MLYFSFVGRRTPEKVGNHWSNQLLVEIIWNENTLERELINVNQCSSTFLSFAPPSGRAGLNEREAPGKVTARPPKRWAQLSTVSHVLVSALQKHRSKTSNLLRFGSLHFRGSWGWPCMAGRMWLICSNKKLYHKKTIVLLRWHYTTIFFVIDSVRVHLHCTNRPSI